MFPELCFPRALTLALFPTFSVPDVLCSRSSVLPEVWISEVLYIPETLCSQSFIFALFPKLCFCSVSSYVCSLPKALFLLCFQLCLLSSKALFLLYSQSFIFARTLCFQSAIYSRNSVFLELSVSTVLLCSQTSVFGVVSEAVYVLECLYYSSSVFRSCFWSAVCSRISAFSERSQRPMLKEFYMNLKHRSLSTSSAFELFWVLAG